MRCDIQDRSISNRSNQLGCCPSDRAQNPTLGELSLSQGGQQLSHQHSMSGRKQLLDTQKLRDTPAKFQTWPGKS